MVMEAIRPFQVTGIKRINGLQDAPKSVEIKGYCMLQNAGAQPAYFDTTKDADASTGAMIAAGETFPQVLYVDSISVVSNTTGTDIAVILLDI